MSKIEELKKLCGELRTLTEQTFDEVKSDKYSKYEDALRSFIDKYFNILAFLFSFLLIGSFFIIKYLL